MDVLKSEAGEFPFKSAAKRVRECLLSHLLFFESLTRAVNCMCDCIHTHEKTLKHSDSISLSVGGQTTLELYMHQSADQILVVIVLMFVTCVNNKA